MTAPTYDRERLLELADRAVANDLNTQQREELDRLLSSSKLAAAAFVEYLQLDAELSRRIHSQQAVRQFAEALTLGGGENHAKKDQIADSVLPKIEVKPDALSRRFKRFDSIHWQRHKIRFNAMTAVLTALGWIAFSYFVMVTTTPDDSRPNRTGNIQYVAEITGQYEPQWAEGMPLISKHHTFLSGERLNLAEGLIEITFDEGAVVVLEGPTEFVVDSSGAGTLEVGKLTAEVPENARGFTVYTERATVVDLGTNFGVDVSASGVTHIHVFEGTVESTLLDSRGRELQHALLTTGQAIRTNASFRRFVHFDAARSQFAVLPNRGITVVDPELAITSGPVIVSQNFDLLAPGDTSHVGSGSDWGFSTTGGTNISVQAEVTVSSPNSLKHFLKTTAVTWDAVDLTNYENVVVSFRWTSPGEAFENADYLKATATYNAGGGSPDVFLDIMGDENSIPVPGTLCANNAYGTAFLAIPDEATTLTLTLEMKSSEVDAECMYFDDFKVTGDRVGTTPPNSADAHDKLDQDVQNLLLDHDINGQSSATLVRRSLSDCGQGIVNDFDRREVFLSTRRSIVLTSWRGAAVSWQGLITPLGP